MEERTMWKQTLSCLLVMALATIGACSDDTTSKTDTAPAKDTGKPVIDVNSSGHCEVTAFFPVAGKVLDYAMSEGPRVAVNAKELEDIVDGGSEKYKDNKFSCMAEVYYTSASKATKIKIWSFNQTDKTGAEGAYTKISNGSETPITPTIGDASQEDTTLPLNYIASMRKGQYLIQVFVDKKESKDHGVSFLNEIAKSIP
jgi:hypothetical protein